MRNLFLDLMEKEKLTYDYNYDWCNLNEERELESSKIKIEIRRPINLDEIEDENDKVVIREDEDLIEEGEENVIDDSLIDASENDFIAKGKDKNLSDLEDKKNKLLYEE